MALTELQLPIKSEFYRDLQNSATEMDNLMTRWEKIARFISEVDSTDLDAMGVAAGNVRTDMLDFRTVLNEMVALYNGGDVIPTKSPITIIKKIRIM